ncbi:Dirigent domain-containing protein [Cephalotus follicularis]|uniref:Dirigent protein n=1 Tax=Cephalotus follicularis TaxID=3775 RepID=A0A1Q3BSG9_CEPFO|nr:Dirigent domain-containing protein [Cephalotus follicularis]
MSPFNLTTNLFTIIFSLTLLYVKYILPKHDPQGPKQTNLVFYVHDHDYFPGHGINTSANTVDGKSGPACSILPFGTVTVVDDIVTEGPSIESKEIGRAQGLYINSQLDGKGFLYMVFSIIFTDGEFKGSSLEIQGADVMSMKEREFGVVSGTGYFRFVKGYGIKTTQFMDIPNLRVITKLNIIYKEQVQ